MSTFTYEGNENNRPTVVDCLVFNIMRLTKYFTLRSIHLLSTDLTIHRPADVVHYPSPNAAPPQDGRGLHIREVIN